ncbi:MAG: hypothetical protein ACNS62_02175 [Candidatus Cyclobacteriaceae bacterium M3_2C_046]
MKKKECPSCGMEIDKDLNVCPICQYEFPKQSTSYQWIAILLVVLFVLFMLLSIF